MSSPQFPPGGQPPQWPAPSTVRPAPGAAQVPGQFGQPGHVPYGAPPQGTPTWPQQAAPAKKKRRGCLITSLVLLAMFTVAAGAGAWFLLGLGQGRTLWALPNPGDSEDRQNYLSTWFTDKTVVRAQQDGISSLDPATGKRQWGTPVPGKGTVICAASAVTSQHIAVLAYGKTGSCTTVFAVDLTSGRKLWDLPVKKSGEPPSLAVSGGMVVVQDRSAYRLKDGSKAWSAKQLPRKDGCSAGAFTGGPRLVRTQRCPTAKDEFGGVSKVRYIASELAPATGQARWSYTTRRDDDPVEAEEFNGEVLSTDPVVVRESAGAYRILSGKGRPRGLVKIRDKGALGQGDAFMGGSPLPAITMGGSTLVVEQRHSNDEAVDGFDADSGKRLWTTGTSEDVSYDLVQDDNSTLSAVKYDYGAFDPEDTNPFSLVTFDPKTGEEDEQQDFEGVGDALGPSSVPYLHQGRLFLASVSDKGSTDSLTDGGGIGSYHKSSLVTLEP